MRAEDCQTFPASSPSISINELVVDVLGIHRANLENQNITVETDLSSVVAPANEKLIRTALDALIQHANQMMVRGGELSVTLLDGRYEWELEVADSAVHFPNSQMEIDQLFSVPQSKLEASVVTPFSNSRFLETAYQVVLQHGGQLQSWECSKGGTAHVMVVPKFYQTLTV